MRSAPSIAFDYRPAPAIVAFAGAIVVAAASAPWFSAASFGVRAAVSITAAAYGIVALRSFVRIRFARIAYRAAGWVLVDRTYFEVGGDFPRIERSELRPGVEMVNYSIRVSDCVPYSVDADNAFEGVTA